MNTKISTTTETNWPKIEGEMTVDENVAATNPNYATGGALYQTNCQRCVATWEMRMRGFDVVAKPAILPDCDDNVFLNWESIFRDMIWEAGGYMLIKNKMTEWGDGARAQVYISWGRDTQHVFVAVQENGATRFMDPQTGEKDVSRYFERYIKVEFARIDNLEISNYILECSEARK